MADQISEHTYRWASKRHMRLARCCTCRINKCDAESPTPLAGWLAFNQLSKRERARERHTSLFRSRALFTVRTGRKWTLLRRRATATGVHLSVHICGEFQRVHAVCCRACRAVSATAGRVSCARHDCVSNRFLCASCLSVSAAPEKRQRVPSAYNRFIK